MNKRTLAFVVGAGLLVGLGTGCSIPKVLVDQSFLGETRSAKIILTRSAEADGTFDQFLRVCTLDQAGKDTDCKDTLILKNVIPGSVY